MFVPESADGRLMYLATSGGDVSLLMTQKETGKTGSIQYTPENAIELGRQLMELGQGMLDERG